MRCLFWLSQKMFRHKKRRSSECYLAAIHYLSFGGFFANFERETDEHPCLLWARSRPSRLAKAGLRKRLRLRPGGGPAGQLPADLSRSHALPNGGRSVHEGCQAYLLGAKLKPGDDGCVPYLKRRLNLPLVNPPTEATRRVKTADFHAVGGLANLKYLQELGNCSYETTFVPGHQLPQHH